MDFKISAKRLKRDTVTFELADDSGKRVGSLKLRTAPDDVGRMIAVDRISIELGDAQ